MLKMGWFGVLMGGHSNSLSLHTYLALFLIHSQL